MEEAKKLFYTLTFIDDESAKKSGEISVHLLPIEMYLGLATMQGCDLGQLKARHLLDKVQLASHSILPIYDFVIIG